MKNIENLIIRHYAEYVSKLRRLYDLGINIDDFVSDLEILADYTLREIYGDDTTDKIIDYVNNEKEDKESIDTFVKNTFRKVKK